MQKKVIVFQLSFLILCCLSSCSTDSKKLDIESYFKKAAHFKAIDSISVDSLDVIGAYNVIPSGDKFVFLLGQQPHNITLWNRDRNSLTKGVLKGQGPKEVVRFSPVRSNNKDRFYYADTEKKKVFSFPLDSSAILIREEFQLNDSINRFIQLATNNDEIYYGTGSFTAGRICVYNRKNNEVTYAGKYPVIPGAKIISPRHEAALFANGQMCIHPQDNRLCIVSRGIFDFYHFQHDQSLAHVKSLHFDYPKFTMNQYGAAVVYDRENIYAALSTTCSKDYIYILYSENTSKEERTANTILIFDWNGNPIKKYKCNEQLSSITFENNFIHALKYDGSILYKYEVRP